MSMSGETTTLTYAIADLHGRYDLLFQAMEAIQKHTGSTPHKIITLGDYVDRGPQSKEIIEYLIKAQEDGKPVICLRGNHEDIMLQSLTELPSKDWWYSNGGGATMQSYEFSVPEEHLRWLAQLPYMNVDAHRVYVHAGVDPNVPLDQQETLEEYPGCKTLNWMLYPGPGFGGHGDLHVVHGHHQFADGPKLYQNRTDLDTFAWYTGRLVVGVFNDDVPGGPADFLEIKGDPDPRHV